MPSKNQSLGTYGVNLVINYCTCPECKTPNTFKSLPQNFKGTNITCDFCMFRAQVMTKTGNDINTIPKSFIGANWNVIKNRIDLNIYYPLYIVLVDKDNHSNFAIYYLPPDLQSPDIFVARSPLSPNAKRAGWQGVRYDFSKIKKEYIVRLH